MFPLLRSVILFGLDNARDKMQMEFIHNFDKHCAFQKISLVLGPSDVEGVMGIDRTQTLPLRINSPVEERNPPAWW